MRCVLLIFLVISLHSCENKKISPLNSNIVNGSDSIAHLEEDNNSHDERFIWQKPEVVLNKLGDVSGKVIADIGAGTGYFTFRLIRKAEKVIAVDIDPGMLELINSLSENLDPELKKKLETRLALPDNSKLTTAEVDVIIVVNTIGYISNRRVYLKNLRQSLKPGGKIMIADFKIKTISETIAPAPAYRVSILDLENDLISSGYTILNTDDTSLEYQYIVTASL